MNAIESFLKQHNAVPAGELGIDWSNANHAALLGWAKSECKTWDENPSAHARIVDRMTDIYKELVRRCRATRTPPAGECLTETERTMYISLVEARGEIRVRVGNRVDA